jgi:CheY-like chemotaxis protein
MATILLVDDDALLRETVQQLLERDGHRVSTAADGEEGLRRLAEHPVDLLITDVLMPRKDGADFIMSLRRGGSAMPIIAISGGRRVLTPEFNLKTASLAGATVQLAKPFGRAQLQAAVQEALSA